MNKSIFERIFPHSPTSRLPQYNDDDDYASLYASRSPSSPPRISLRDSRSSSSSQALRSLSPRQTTSPANKPAIRSNDPFLHITRASNQLQRTFQTLLDAQSEGLSAGIGLEDDTSSFGSPTPTPSHNNPVKGGNTVHGPKVIPIRQPRVRKMTLRAARKGLFNAMREFADIKSHETSSIDQEIQSREHAVKIAADLAAQRTTLQGEIDNIRHQESSRLWKDDLAQVELEIRTLENRLSELRVRQRYLSSKIEEDISTKESKLSSYREAFRLGEARELEFLRNPPISQGLATTGGHHQPFYTLKPDRRTLEMAMDQWGVEIEELQTRRSKVEKEKDASMDGSRLWRDAVKRIIEFERDLKAQTQEVSASQLQSYSGDSHLARIGLSTSMEVVVTKLTTLIHSLEWDLGLAEKRGWNLLVVAIGAEVAAFQQARELLSPTKGLTNEDDLIEDSLSESNIDHQDDANADLVTGDEPTPINTNGSGTSFTNKAITPTRSPSRPASVTSNQSLEDTLREFGPSKSTGASIIVNPGRTISTDRNDNDGRRNETQRADGYTGKPLGRSMYQSQGEARVSPENPLTTSASSRHGSSEKVSGDGKVSEVRSQKDASHVNLRHGLGDDDDDDDDPSPDFFLSHS
ncbi:hypothetical protein B0A52_04528 [Exophiala mesophila]|uniref:Autophagy-related protein 28 n=1 Tax=Exophiala mesophila TaxID=212818 RepID=A0A438N969_EXOME|nr:hypothetical protein B0A52_04528 [Exophiala mesophila]